MPSALKTKFKIRAIVSHASPEPPNTRRHAAQAPKRLSTAAAPTVIPRISVAPATPGLLVELVAQRTKPRSRNTKKVKFPNEPTMLMNPKDRP
jgi:hypothetical protein